MSEDKRMSAWVEFLKKYGMLLDMDQWNSYLYMALDDPDKPFPPPQEDSPYRHNLSTFVNAFQTN